MYFTGIEEFYTLEDTILLFMIVVRKTLNLLQLYDGLGDGYMV